MSAASRRRVDWATANPRVAVIILNWNNAADTLECLASVRETRDACFEIVVVDNRSTDDSLTALCAARAGFTLLQTGANLGYAGGNNLGIRHALAHGAGYICILNNDVIVAADFLDPLMAALHEDRDVGVTTPLVAQWSAPDTIWALGSAVDRRTGTVSRLHAGEPLLSFAEHSPFAVDIAPGAAILVKREVFERVGLIDEDFYLYYEESDWCLRVQAAGYQILAVPQSLVWHKVSATLGQASPIIDYYMLRNHLRLVVRHWSGAARWRILGRLLMRNLLTIAAYTAKSHGGRRLTHRNARLLGLRDALLGRWGKMGGDVEAALHPSRQ